MYRVNNGWVDDGHSVNKPNARCPNCGSSDYKETISMESCKSCGIVFDYWGGGANKQYQDMMNREAEDRAWKEHQRNCRWSDHVLRGGTIDDFDDKD